MPPLLVTGSHRSGTTWVGKMLAQSPHLAYLFEPFNASVTLDLAHHRFDRWYTYAPDAEAAVRRVMDRVTTLRYPLREAWRDAATAGDYKRAIQRTLRYARHRLAGRTPLIKDPIALLSAEWLDAHYDLRVVVLIRHPAAFAGSLKKKGWTFPFGDLLAQEQLMQDHLAPFADDLRAFAAEERDVVDQAALLWTILYRFVAGCRERHDDWVFLRHEDLARSPVEEFRDLYGTLGLSFTTEIRRRIEAHSSRRASARNDDVDSHVQRDSRSVITNWKDRLTSDEIARVRRRTAPVAGAFYDSSDW